MSEICPWTERVLSAGEPLDEEIARHAENCAECSAELAAHHELLAAFRGIARPALSPHFRPHLMAQLEVERDRKQAARRRFASLRLYWLAASVVCAAVVANLTWFASNPAQQAPVLFAIAAFTAPIAILLLCIRVNPFELIFQTLEPPLEDSLSE